MTNVVRRLLFVVCRVLRGLQFQILNLKFDI